MDNITETYTEYASIEEQIKLLTEKKEGLRDVILKHLVDNDMKQEKHTLGTFSVTTSKSWFYPASVSKKIEAIKAEIKEKSEEVKAVEAKAQSVAVAAKTTEEAEALAQNESETAYVEKPGLRFVSIKI